MYKREDQLGCGIGENEPGAGETASYYKINYVT